jgi:predicted Zn finger-like uncharacterized protein
MKNLDYITCPECRAKFSIETAKDIEIINGQVTAVLCGNCDTGFSIQDNEKQNSLCYFD